MSLRYFGTDGVRGPALQGPLSPDACTRWGQAWGRVARARGIRQLVVGWDPRLSSEVIVQAFLAGLGSALETELLGVVPTPVVAWITAGRQDAWGLMVSASHNPPGDNGLKGFDGRGEKLGEADEAALELVYEAVAPCPVPPTRLLLDAGPAEAYLSHLEGLDLPDDFPAVVDCAHGATAPWASRLLRGKGLTWLGTPADGAHINVGVGSTHLEMLQETVRARGASLGIAFDGDGDRCLLVDSTGELVDGDQMLWLLVQDRLAAGDPTPGVVGTLMTNGGLEAALAGAGVPFVRTPVGDKFLLREMALRGWDLAAEASGHLIQKRVGPSGDGLATALAILKALLRRPADTRWAWRFRSWPLRLVNLQAQTRVPLDACTHLQAARASLERSCPGIRLVLRWSGTEPKLRLMAEASEEHLVDEALEHLAAAARRDLGLAP